MGAQKFVVVEYCETENDYPVDHFIVGFNINNKMYYLDSKGLFTEQELIDMFRKSTDNSEIFIIPWPKPKNIKKKIWSGEMEMWWNENIMKDMSEEIYKKIKHLL